MITEQARNDGQAAGPAAAPYDAVKEDETTRNFAAPVVDARGHRCPIPTLRLQRALQPAPLGSVMILLADDPMARIDVPHFAEAQGHAVLEITSEGDALRIVVRKRASAHACDLTSEQNR